MENLLATGLAIVAVALTAIAILAMTVRNLRVAGFCFLSVSLIVYLRETRVVSD